MVTVTRADLAKAVSEEAGLPHCEAKVLVDMLIEAIAAPLAAGEDVSLLSFGSFKLRSKAARTGRNPKMREAAAITPRRVVTFRASQALKNRIAEGHVRRRGRQLGIREPRCYKRAALSLPEGIKRIMDRTSSKGIDESALSKGERRKLNALRKSVGDEIGERAFLEWLSSRPTGSENEDLHAATILDILWPLVEEGRLKIPRGGYLLRRGRGRIIVEPAQP